MRDGSQLPAADGPRGTALPVQLAGAFGSWPARGTARDEPIIPRTLHGRAGPACVVPAVIGHRGAAASAPENTLAGLRCAAALGCRWVELDVRLTADRRPVVIHDSRLQRTTDGRGRVSARSLAAIRRHDAGAWFAPSFTGERVPTLDEVLSLLAVLGIGANIELKAPRGAEAETGDVVADALARQWPCELPPPLLSSFQRKALAAAQRRAPGISRGMLFRAVPRSWRAIAESCGCATIHADHRRLSPALVARIRETGYPVLAYTVNDAGRARELFDWGVTSVFSDVPRLLLEALPGDDYPAAADTLPAGRLGQGRVR